MSRWLQAGYKREAAEEESFDVFIKDFSADYGVYLVEAKHFYDDSVEYKKCYISNDGLSAECVEVDPTNGKIILKSDNKSFEEVIAPASWMKGAQIDEWNSKVSEVINKIKK